MSASRLTIGSLLAVCAVAACSEGSGTLDVYLLQSPNVSEDPLEPSLVTHLNIRVTGPDMDPVEETFTTVEIGDDPYTYSDMTGVQLLNVIVN